MAKNDPGPSTEPRFASGVSASSGPVRNSSRTSAGAASITIRPRLSDSTVNADPYFRLSRRIVPARETANLTARTARGLLGPSGRTAADTDVAVIAAPGGTSAYPLTVLPRTPRAQGPGHVLA